MSAYINQLRKRMKDAIEIISRTKDPEKIQQVIESYGLQQFISGDLKGKLKKAPQRARYGIAAKLQTLYLNEEYLKNLVSSQTKLKDYGIDVL